METSPSGHIRNDHVLDEVFEEREEDLGPGGGAAYEDDERGGWGNKLDFLFSCRMKGIFIAQKMSLECPLSINTRWIVKYNNRPLMIKRFR